MRNKNKITTCLILTVAIIIGDYLFSKYKIFQSKNLKFKFNTTQSANYKITSLKTENLRVMAENIILFIENENNLDRNSSYITAECGIQSSELIYDKISLRLDSLLNNPKGKIETSYYIKTKLFLPDKYMKLFISLDSICFDKNEISRLTYEVSFLIKLQYSAGNSHIFSTFLKRYNKGKSTNYKTTGMATFQKLKLTDWEIKNLFVLKSSCPENSCFLKPYHI